jgi:hypothetical protein
MPPPRTIGAALPAVKNQALNGVPKKVEGISAYPAHAFVRAADEVAGEQRIVEQRDVVAKREEAAPAARLNGVEVLAFFYVEVVHHTCDKE